MTSLSDTAPMRLSALRGTILSLLCGAFVALEASPSAAAEPCRSTCEPGETKDAKGCCSAPPPPCPFGRVRVHGAQCCWPGQDVGAATGRCVGKPASCPVAMVLTDTDCVCEPGKVLVSGHCCWPGQDFGTQSKACVGKPLACPAGLSPAIDGCVTHEVRARREGMLHVPASTVELAPFASAARSGRVEVAAFELEESEVTVAAYESCVRAGACAKPGSPTETPKASSRAQEPLCNAGKARRAAHPMNCVSQEEAQAYCAWKKRRLPTEEEWQAAAEGGEGRPYPWGTEPPAGRACWDGAGSAAGAGKREGTCAVKSIARGKSAQGAFDLAGNVWEWTSSCIDASCKQASVRGGSWVNQAAGTLRGAMRQGEAPATRSPGLGFRCARNTP
jgi:formylglycine-generating enzyme required for sulfatase activity